MIEFLARRVWWAMLWFMRRPWIRRWRIRWLRQLHEQNNQRAVSSFVRQERWARRHGLTVLRVAIGFFVVTTFAQIVAVWVLHQQTIGAFPHAG